MTLSEIKKVQELDNELVSLAGHIKLLSFLSWPARIADEFLLSWQRKNPQLPSVTYPKIDLTDVSDRLKQLIKKCDTSHPISNFIGQSASSYLIAAHMLENVQTPKFCELSQLLYGNPRQKIGHTTNLEFAEDFIGITGDFVTALSLDEPNIEKLSAHHTASELQLFADETFKENPIQVLVDAELSSKAAAGAERVRIRSDSYFTRAEIQQLIQHELMVHTATALNGRHQPNFKCFALGSPRTTGTQEGLATFAELITTTMDINRLRRIALRIKGIDIALNGGNFIDVFSFFVNAGQPERDSFQSASRIFRGSSIHGTHVFTKDVVYLKGLFSVHTFLRKAIKQRKIHYPEYLFCGRMTISDVVALEPLIEDGTIVKPRFLPTWVKNKEGLAAYLSYAAFANKLRLDDISLDDFVTDLDIRQF